MKYRTLIVDDEPLARRNLMRLLAGEADFELVGEAEDGQAALEMLEASAVDVLFLDIRMPRMGGFDVLEHISADRMPVVVFVTAYDEFAVRAFEFASLDYLLKPFDRERFEKTLDRIRGRRREAPEGDVLSAVLRELKERTGAPSRLVIKSDGRIVLVRVDDIDWVEAAENYVYVHAGKDCHLLRQTMQRMEEMLDRERFVRVHRSAIVNLDRVKEINPTFHGEYIITLVTGAQAPLSRSYRDRVFGALGKV